jgi:hypothetical protein
MEPVSEKIKIHTFTIALASEDVLVLATDEHDEYHRPRDNQYPVNLFYVDRVNSAEWKIISAGRQAFLGQHNVVQVHPFLRLQLRTPFKTVKNHKGQCALFVVEITHGYRLHFLDFVKTRLPHIYAKLSLD